MDASEIKKLLAEYGYKPHPHRSGEAVLDVVFADPGNNGFYYRERHYDSRAAFIRTDHVAYELLRLTARITALEAQVAAADRLAASMVSFLSPFQDADFGRQMREHDERVAALADFRAAKGE